MCSEPINGPVIPAGIPRSSQSSVRGRHILDLSHTERFDNLDQRGCIFSLFFNVANRAGGHTTTAATITFLPGHICPGAIQLQSLWPCFFTRGHRINIHHNHRKASEGQTKPYKTTQHGRPSRVVTVSGPKNILCRRRPRARDRCRRRPRRRFYPPQSLRDRHRRRQRRRCHG